MTEPVLRIEALSKRFGGVVACNDVMLTVNQPELHAIIGPNGAGKTTLLAQLSGELTPDAGRVLFDGADITRMPPWRRSLRGMARSFQITSVFLDLTALDNIALAVQAHAGHSFHFWRNARMDSRLREPSRAILTRVGLGGREDAIVSHMSHGEHRQLEIAMALAARPRLLLLDEPMAGMGPEESAQLVSMLRDLKKEYAILLIEHDMDAVFALADRISVLVYGRVIASGLPDEIRNNAEVKQAYLGEGKRTAHV